MKKIGLFILAAILFSCSEKEITSQMNVPNYYEITDSDDPIQHRRFDIFQKYGVSVYFNDTICVIPIGTDYYGKPVYKTERVDVNWSFEGANSDDIKYVYHDLSTSNGVDGANVALDVIEEYLKSSSKSIYPTLILAVKSATYTDLRGNVTTKKNGQYGVYFRSLLLTGDYNSSGVARDNVVAQIRLEIVKSRISKFESFLSDFKVITPKEYYGVQFSEVKGFKETLLTMSEEEQTILAIEFGEDMSRFGTAGLQDETWWLNMQAEDYTPEEIAMLQQAVRKLVGQYGFVYGYSNATHLTPFTADDDVELFLIELLRQSKADFQKKWGELPMVMKKANVLYGIIENKIGIELK